MGRPASGEDAFDRFYGATAPAIRAYILGHCSDRDAADDLFQSTYIRFLRSRMASQPDAPEARAYLYRIASSVIADHGRELQRRRRLQTVEAPPPKTRDPTSTLAESLALREALRELSRRERQLLWLLYAEGFSHKEVAKIMNLSRGSVRVLAFRVRKKLARSIAERGPDSEEVRA